MKKVSIIMLLVLFSGTLYAQKTYKYVFLEDLDKQWATKPINNVINGSLGIMLERFEYAVAHKDRNFGNARYARNVFEKSIQSQANRLAGQSNLSKTELTELTIDDLKDGFAARTNITQ